MSMYRTYTVRTAMLLTMATLAIAGCQRQGTPLPIQPASTPIPSPAAQASPAVGDSTIKKGGEGAMAKKGAVAFLNLRSKVLAGSPLQLTWQVNLDEAKKIGHTAVHYDTVSHPGEFGTDVTPDAAGYKNLTPDFAKGEFLVPRAFSATVTPPAGTLYLRAHAIVDGANYWTAEEQVAVAADPASLGEGGGEMKKVDAVKTFKLTAKQWAFDPAEIRVKKGDRVKLEISSVDVAHGFGLPDFNVNQKLEPGKTVTVEFTADKAGTFTYSCNVLCGTGHKEMKGKLIVE